MLPKSENIFTFNQLSISLNDQTLRKNMRLEIQKKCILFLNHKF